ncbi:alpha/beta hydrolase-fold protein [Pseudoxanthomonas sp.]|uniref:alpha/beta hydrolase n=1 Tax=Pseudoxanthomonas sp. TaxID=1871049 RepID=UPI0028C3FB8D|nr:alpha/beta hydrolase-fold protein [Pseudoxanthomonas sp.]
MALALLLGVAATAAPAAAQPDLTRRTGSTVADAAVPGWRWQVLRAASADGQRHYRIRVAVPQQTPPGSGFPVAYLLDGNAALMETDSALLQRLAASPRPPVIAYIAHDNDLRIDPDARAYDYTPRRPGGEDAQRDAIGDRRNGGADAFLDLIERDIAPQVEALAPVDRGRRALWGHSYGGVFVLHALFSRPGLFSGYAAADPSLWWGQGRLLEEEAGVAAWPSPSPRLWLWVGDGGGRTPPSTQPDRDPGAMDAMRRARASVPPDATPRMAERLRGRGLDVRFETLAGQSHGQTLGASLHRLLETLAASPDAPREGNAP